jgi:predicted PurR-regulated permease PerM
MTEQPPVLDAKAGDGLQLAEEAPLMTGQDEHQRERELLHLHMPVDVRSVSLAVLALLATLFVLHWAKQVFIPVLLGVMLSYALSPIVNWAERLRVPRYFSAALILLSLLASMGVTIYSLSDDARDLIETLPVAAQKLRQEVRERRKTSSSALETVQKAAAQIEQAAQESGAGATAQTRGVTRVVIEKPKFNITDYLWSGTVGLLALMAQITLVIFLTFFLMVSGDLFRRKLIKVAGSTLSSKKITLQALHEITHQIQRYLQVQLFTSALVGVLTWVVLLVIGLEHAAVWGVAAGVLNLIPYVGSLIITGSSALVGFLQFGTVEMALVVAGASLVIHTVVGNLLTPWLTSRAGRMNPVAVFIGLLAWGWLWGVWGLLLGIPVLMVVKTICDRIEDLKPVGEFLGD